MFWFDPTASFKRRFEPTEGGYLYYPKAKGGGKLLSEVEYNDLIINYRRWIGARFRPGLIIWTMMGACVAITLVATVLDLSESFLNWAIAGVAIGFVIAQYWIQSTAYRLYHNRPDSTPPRTKQEIKRAARKLLTWPLLMWMIAIFGLMTFTGIIALVQRPSLATGVLALLFAVALVQLLRMTVQKLRDRKQPSDTVNPRSGSDPPTASRSA